MSNGVEYTDVDLNSTGTTTVYDPAHDATVHGVHLRNGGSSAEARVEVTDGTDTSTVAEAAAGESIHFDGPLALDGGQSLQVNVTTAEGSAQTNTASVSAGD